MPKLSDKQTVALRFSVDGGCALGDLATTLNSCGAAQNKVFEKALE